MELYTYQKELLFNRDNVVFVNWSRGAGLTTTIKDYILRRKPKRVGFTSYAEKDSVSRLLLEELKNNEGIFVKEYFIDGVFEVYYRDGRKQQTTLIDFHKGSKVDLLITDPGYVALHNMTDSIEKVADKIFAIKTGNMTNYEIPNLYDSQSIIDYKRVLEEGQFTIDHVIEEAKLNKYFYDQLAILDKPKYDQSFDNFKRQALQKLQKQFLDTADTKDTVLTRKNIIEMIKDLQMIK